MRRGLVMGMVLGLLVGAAPAMADTLDDAAKRGSLKICVAEGAPLCAHDALRALDRP